MKTGRSIQETCREIERQAAAKVDYQVNTSRIFMEPYEGTPMLRVLDEQGEDLVEPMDIRQTAHEQIGTYLNIPRKYYDRMQAEDPDLLAYNVNRWFRKNPEQRMIRTMDGHARAFLSNRYASESNIQDAFGWELITEAQYERYFEIFREGEEALEKHTPTVNERVCEILRSIRGDVMCEQQSYRYEAMSPDELRAELKRRQESKREWAERLKAIREKRALAPEQCEAYGARGKENAEI